MWEFITDFVIPLITILFILYSSWHGMKLKTGKIEIELYSIKQFFKKERK